MGRFPVRARAVLVAVGATLWVVTMPASAGPAAAERAPQIRSVVFAGNDAFDERELLRWMRQRPARPFLSSGYLAAEFLQDLERLRRLYIGEGYLAAEITAEVDSSRIDRGSVDLRVTIREGPRWRLLSRALFLRGPEHSAALAETLEGALEVEAPGPYRSRALVADRERLYRALAARGLLDARVRVLVARDDSCRTAILRYEVDTGPRARLGGLRLHGLLRTSRSVVDREITLRPDHVLLPSDLGATRANLIRTGLFSDVQVAPTESDSGVDRKDVIIAVQEAPSGDLGAGVGYGTSDRARVSASWEYRNLLGRALRTEIRGVIGERRRGLEAELLVPWVFGRRIAAALGAGHEHVSPRSYRAERSRASLLLARAIGFRWRLDVGYSVERVRLLRSRAASPGPQADRLGRLSSFVSRDSRNDLFFPRRGTYARAQADWVSPRLGSKQNFLRTEAEHRGYVTLGRLTLSSRMRGGWTVQQDRARPVPLTERLFAGGAQSVRGFSEDAIGPVGPSEVPQGGRILALAAAEARAALRPWLATFVFADAGQLVRQPEEFAWGSVSVGAGGGVDAGQPFGRVRLTLGWPLTRRFGDGVQLYLGTGSTF